MNFSDILNSLGQGMSGTQPGAQPGAFGSDWTSPTGSGLSAYNPQGVSPITPMPLHSPGLLQSILSEPQQQSNPMGGLHELLMRLGVIRQQQ